MIQNCVAQEGLGLRIWGCWAKSAGAFGDVEVMTSRFVERARYVTCGTPPYSMVMVDAIILAGNQPATVLRVSANYSAAYYRNLLIIIISVNPYVDDAVYLSFTGIDN